MKPWFKHYNNANKSDLLVELMTEFGDHKGYAIYFMFIEYCHSIWDGTEHYRFKIPKKELPKILRIGSKCGLQSIDKLFTMLCQSNVKLFTNDLIWEFEFPKLLKIQDKDSKYDKNFRSHKSGFPTLDKEEDKDKDKEEDNINISSNTNISSNGIISNIHNSGNNNILPVTLKGHMDKKNNISKINTKATWDAYIDAYKIRYTVDPIRNTTVNSQMLNFVKRLGIELSPLVARFYVMHDNYNYVKNCHKVGLLLQDAEKLATEYNSGQKMTNLRAYQIEKTQSTNDSIDRGFKIFKKIKEEKDEN